MLFFSCFIDQIIERLIIERMDQLNEVLCIIEFIIFETTSFWLYSTRRRTNWS